ncbi:MAG: protein lplB [Clostridiales bacterium]|nr:protein lplB [Clostridiales bacterium]
MISDVNRNITINGGGINHKHLYKRIWKARWLYFLMMPGLLYFIIYKYLPMWGILMAFQNYQPYLGIMGSKWVGLRHFERFFMDPQFMMLLKNTLIIATYNLIFYFPIPILIALLLNEIRHELFKKTVQTMIYLPHFISWVVVSGMTYMLLSTTDGAVNYIIEALGFSKINFLMNATWMRPLLVIQSIWKEAGWGTIIFLAALAGVDVQLYESARIEGASRFQQTWYITLPSIKSTIIVLLILRLGNFLDLGFEQIFLMLNAMNREVGEVFDTYVYTTGVLQGQFSYSTAVGLFKSVVGLILVLFSNYIAKRLGEEGLY